MRAWALAGDGGIPLADRRGSTARPQVIGTLLPNTRATHALAHRSTHIWRTHRLGCRCCRLRSPRRGVRGRAVRECDWALLLAGKVAMHTPACSPLRHVRSARPKPGTFNQGSRCWNRFQLGTGESGSRQFV